MTELSFDVVAWLHAGCGDKAARATLGSLRIAAGQNLRIPVTEVEDTLAQTVRTHINVPLIRLAEWLLMNWWRLRWEGRRARPTSEWRQAHSLSAIGGDDAWPALEFSADGESVQLYMAAERTADVSGIRCLRSLSLEIPSRSFESAVDRLLDVVEGRLASLTPDYRELAEVWKARRPESQRFYLARLIGAARVLAAEQHLLPVTSGGSALQKLQRSFAQELLCPWEALDEYTDESGLGDDALADAAAYFEVSEYVVRSALVNRDKAPRGTLPPE